MATVVFELGKQTTENNVESLREGMEQYTVNDMGIKLKRVESAVQTQTIVTVDVPLLNTLFIILL